MKNLFDKPSDIAYSRSIKEVRTTAEFDAWYERLRDGHAVTSIARRLQRIEHNNYGDHKRFKGLIELRIPIGPGYRLYCVERQKFIVFVLAGGTKSGQDRDIKQALRIAETV